MLGMGPILWKRAQAETLTLPSYLAPLRRYDGLCPASAPASYRYYQLLNEAGERCSLKLNARALAATSGMACR
jgi:hypothetical protein